MRNSIFIICFVLGVSRLTIGIDSIPFFDEEKFGISQRFPLVSLATTADKPADKPADPTDKPADKPKEGVADYIKDLLGSMNAISATWGSIASAFKTTNSAKLQQIIKGEGFDKFAGSGAMNQITGLVEDVFDDYMKNLMDTIEVPADKQKNFNNAMKFVKFSDSNTWNAYDLTFSKGSGGTCKYVCLLFNHDSVNKKYNIFVADIKAQFSLAPDIAVIGHSKSIAGGIYSSETIEYKEMPVSITEADIQMIFSFFKIVSFKNFADMLGLKLDFPDISTPPNKPPTNSTNSTLLDYVEKFNLRRFNIAL